MTTATIRQKLITYIAGANEDKLKVAYGFLESDIKSEESFELSGDEFEMLLKEQELHLSGESKSYTRQEAKQIIKGERGY